MESKMYQSGYSGFTGYSYKGLFNRGATSHLNSVLQVLFMTKDFREAVQRHSDAQSLDRYLKTLFDELKNRSADPSDIIKKLGIKSDNKIDAAECFENIMRSVSSHEASQLFRGLLIHKDKCSTCSTETSTDNPFWSLPLEVEESSNEYRVVDEVNKFFTETDVCGSNQLYCEQCAAKSDATMKAEMKNHPEVLTVQLKKFKFDPLYSKNVKIYRPVLIPLTLHLPHDGAQSQEYELYAFVEHYGYTAGENYTVTIKSQDDGKWYEFDNTAVGLRSWQLFQADVSYRSLNACLLFYRKISSTNTLTRGIGETFTSEGSKHDTRGKKEQHNHDVNAKEEKEHVSATYVKLYSVDTQKTDENKRTVNDSDGGTVDLQRNQKEIKTEQNRNEAQNLNISNPYNNATQSDGAEGESTANSLTQGVNAVFTSKASECVLRDESEQRHLTERKVDDHLPQDMKYHGLFKKGATSYLNSVLQVLFMTKDFREAVQRHSCDIESLDNYLKTLFDVLKKESADTSDIIKKLGIRSVYDQGDAAECFENILSRMSITEASQLFQGLLTLNYRCSTCGTETSTDIPGWSLSLELAESHREYNVVDEVNRVFTESDVRGTTRLNCDHCAAKSDATVKTEMKHHPEVLTLRLRKFKFDHYHRRHVKITCRVQIASTLQIPHDGAQSQVYELYAFVEHFDYTAWGDHVITIKSQDDGKWYKFHDNRITMLQCQPIQLDTKHGSLEVCLLFYRKVSASNSLTPRIDEVSNGSTRVKKEQWEQDAKTRHKNEDEVVAAMKLYNVDRQKSDESERIVNDGRDKDSSSNGQKQRGEEKIKTDQKTTEAKQPKSGDLCKNHIQSNRGEEDGLVNALSQDTRDMYALEAPKHYNRGKNEQHGDVVKTKETKMAEEATFKTVENRVVNVRKDQDRGIAGEKQRDEEKTNQNIARAGNLKISDLCNFDIQSSKGEGEGTTITLTQDISPVSTSGTSQYDLRHKTEQNDCDAKNPERKKGIKYHGLTSRGTSHLNSVLQVLFMTKDFREAVQRHSCDIESLDTYLRTLFDDLKKHSADTSDIAKKLKIRSGYNQGDPTECFEDILSSLTIPEASQLFQVMLTHKYKCSRCHKKTSTDIPYWSLPLEMVEPSRNYSVVDEVNKIFTESDVSRSNKLSCSKCGAKSDATVKAEMKRHPDVLTLQLKTQYGKYVKIPCRVQIPPTLESQLYELYAFAERSDFTTYRHYTVTIKSPDDGKWYKFGDTNVTMPSNQPFQADAYLRSRDACLLFYRNVSAKDTLTQDMREAPTPEACKQHNRGNKEQHHYDQDKEEPPIKPRSVDRPKTDQNKRAENDSDGRINVDKQRKGEEVKINQNRTDRQETFQNREVNVREAQGKEKQTDEEKEINQNRTREGHLEKSGLCNDQNQTNERDCESTVNSLIEDISVTSTSASKNELRDETKQRDHDAKSTERKEVSGKTEQHSYEAKTSETKEVSRKHAAEDLRTKTRSSAGIRYHGLSKKGGMSHLNSVLQVLFMTKDFREAVQRHGCDAQSFDGYLKTLFDEMKKDSADTSDITKELGIKSVDDQGDAAECFNKILSNVSSSEASQLFQGLLTHKYKCSGCGKETSADIPFWSLSLELEKSDKGYNSLVDELDRFFTESDISKSKKLLCDQCDDKHALMVFGNKIINIIVNPFLKSNTFEKQQKFEMKQHPAYLTLHLKRFKFDQHYQEVMKMEGGVEVPHILKMSQSGAQSQNYELYAFVEHNGGLRYGHYSVNIKSRDDGKWYKFKDDVVTLLSKQPFQWDTKHRSWDAYLLFYRKISTTDTLTQDTSEASSSGTCKHGTRSKKEQHYPDAKTRKKQEDAETAAVKQKTDENKRSVYDRGEWDRWTGVEKQKGIKYHGLLNQGATCYLNSVLQVLFMTKDFRQAVQSHSSDDQSLDVHLNNLFEELKKNEAYTYKITKELGITRVNVQSDAAECLENILNRLSSHEASQLFKGQLTQKYKCSTCGTETSTDNPVWSLPLEFEDSYKDFCVVEGVRKYFSESEVSGPNQLYCDCCAAKTDATMKAEMKRYPDVLTLLLKRFKFDYSRMTFVKINASVKIPYKLEIPHHGGQSQAYELYAYVEHFGDLRFGHYTATIKSQDNDKWYCFNDTRVTEWSYQPFQVDPTEISPGAYLLFYRKNISEVTSEASLQDSRDEHQQHDDHVKRDEGTAVKHHYNENKLDDEMRVVNRGGGSCVEEQSDEMLADQNSNESHTLANDVQINKSEGYSDCDTSKSSQERKQVVSDCSQRQNEQQREAQKEKMRTGGDHSSGMDVTDNGCDSGANLDAVQHNKHYVKDQSSGRQCEFIGREIVGNEEVEKYMVIISCQQIKGTLGNQLNQVEYKKDAGGDLCSHKGLNERDGESNTNNYEQFRRESESHCDGSKADQETVKLHDQPGPTVIHPSTAHEGHESGIHVNLTQKTQQGDADTASGANTDCVDGLASAMNNLSLNDPSVPRGDGDINMTEEAENDLKRDRFPPSGVENMTPTSSYKQVVEKEPEESNNRGVFVVFYSRKNKRHQERVKMR